MNKSPAVDPETTSRDVVAENLSQLKALFPEVVIDGIVDIDVFGQLVGQTVGEVEEKFGLNWSGKRAARQLALLPSSATLRPRPEESVDWDTTQNLMIEGENLEVLKLLQRGYAGRIKLIYVDPPYNTGSDFVYPDSFHDTLRHYEQLMGWRTEEGGKLSSAASRKNTETSGRFHTAWLNMIYPRLKLARPLLTQDGAIFVSCDETEHPRLRLVMDELFGEENFVADIVWAAGRKNDSRLISVSHEYLVCYARDAGHLARHDIQWRQRKKGLAEIYAQYERLKRQYGAEYAASTAGMKRWFKALPDDHPAKAHRHYCHIDGRGLYFPDNISWPGGGGPKYEVLHPQTGKPVAVPSRGWMTADAEKMRQWIAEDRVHFGPDESSVPCIKSYLKDREWQAPYSVFYQDGRAATKRLRELMGGDCFDFPKDETVLQELVGMLTAGDDLVLDFFAGSGATGHAVMAQNAADAGCRRFILVQLPEPLDPTCKEQQAAAELCDRLGRPRHIAELTKERLRRAAGKLRAADAKRRERRGLPRLPACHQQSAGLGAGR